MIDVDSVFQEALDMPTATATQGPLEVRAERDGDGAASTSSALPRLKRRCVLRRSGSLRALDHTTTTWHCLALTNELVPCFVVK